MWFGCVDCVVVTTVGCDLWVAMVVGVVWVGFLLGFVGFWLLGFVDFMGSFVASGGGGGCSVVGVVLNNKIKQKKLIYCVFYIILLY